MSILEIVLYSIIGLSVSVYIGKGIFDIIYYKKHPEKYQELKLKKAERRKRKNKKHGYDDEIE